MSVDDDVSFRSDSLILCALLEAQKEIDQLRIAMEHRNIIGQAQGILMVRMNVTADQAFAYIRRLSNQSNRKLFDLAEDIVATRDLPEQ